MAAKRVRGALGRLIVLLALVSLGLFAVNPLLEPRLPEAHDVRFHLYRLVQLDSLVRRGVLFSRWAPELAYGYGFPIFNYYAPAVYYAAEPFHLVGLSYTATLRLTFALALVGMAGAMYAWVRDLFDASAAFVAAAAYVTAPYMMILVAFRGALAELAALALAPAILWATHRFATRGRSIYGVLGATLYALLILTHNITAMLFTPLLLGYGISLGLATVSSTADRVWRKVGSVAFVFVLVLGVGLGRSAFFWIPALVERDLVHIHQLYLPSSLRFENHFTTLSDMFGLPRPADPRLVYQPRPMSRFHLGGVALAALALAGLWRDRRRSFQKIVGGFAFLGALASIFMSLPVSQPLWRRIPLLPFVQFPSRFIGLGSFFVALLAGAALYVWRDLLSRWRWLIVVLLVVMLTLYVIPWQYARRYPPLGELTLVDSAQFERQTGSLGTTTMGEFLPNTVHALPEDDSPALYHDNQRLDTASLPAGATLQQAVYGPLRYDVLLESPEAFTAVFHTFDFPGWRAEIDGEPAPILPTDPHGLISVAVPAGQHRLVVEFGTTPVRAWATGLSLVSLLGLIGWVLSKTSPQARGWLGREPGSRPTRVALGVLVAVVSVLFFKYTYVDREGQQTPLRRTRFDGQSVAGVDHPLRVNFANRLRLLGADTPAHVASGKTLETTLYWSVPARVDTEYSVGLALVDARGVRYGSSDHQHPGGYPPTTRWRPVEYAEDPHALRILPGTPPGTYTLRATVYPYGQPEQTLDVLDAQGAPVGRAATVAPVQVTRPQNPPTREQLTPQTPVEAPVTAGVRLIGYDLPASVQRAGDLLPLILYWEAEATPKADLEIKLALHHLDGKVVPLATVLPVGGYPTSQWSAGDRWRGVHRLLLPPTVESGAYRLTLDVPHVEPLTLGVVIVEAPEHVLAPPPVAHAQSAIFGDLVSLIGYQLPPEDGITAGDRLSVKLVWRVHRQTRVAYKTFVHLLDAEGRRVAGSDQVPGDWQRPTTGWIAGEYVVDAHTLDVPVDLPEGTYRLQVGLYHEETGERLSRPDGADTAVLETPLDVRE